MSPPAARAAPGTCPAPPRRARRQPRSPTPRHRCFSRCTSVGVLCLIYQATAIRPRTSALVLPILPLHIVSLEVAGNSDTNGWKEVLFAELCEQSESFQLVLHRIFELGKAKLDAHRVQRSVLLSDDVACGDVGASHRFGCDDQPAYRSWRARHRVQRALLK